MRVARWAGLGLVLTIACASAFAPLITGRDPNASGDDLLTGPSAEHWFGTDDLGRDVLTRTLHGGRISLTLGLGAAALGCAIGVPVGIAAGFARGWASTLLTQLIDLFIALPALVLALVVTVVVGPTLGNLMLVLGLVQWPGMARLVRGQSLVLREMAFVEAAWATGNTPAAVVRRHIWPNLARIVAAQFAISVSAAIFTSASLSFLGLGLPPPTPDWGGMVQGGFEYLSLNPLLCFGPGAAVTLTIFAFYVLGRTVD